MRIAIPSKPDGRQIRLNRWVSPAVGRTLLIVLGVTALIFLASVRAGANCNAGGQKVRCTSPIYVADETAGSAPNIASCNSMNGVTLNFGSFPKNGNQSMTLRACVCPTDAHANEIWAPGANAVDLSGIEFLNVGFMTNTGFVNSTTDFTIVGSGCVVNGNPTPFHGDNQGTHGVGFAIPPNNNNNPLFPGCPGNPPNYCYADIKFQPKEYGNPLNAMLNFDTECPGVVEGTFNPNLCEVQATSSVINYLASVAKLQGTGSGFGILQPPTPVAGATPYALSTPTSTVDPGSVKIAFQAQTLNSTDTTKWFTPVRYEASGMEQEFTTQPGLQFSTTGERTTTQTFTGQGGFLNATAMADSAFECVVAPITGWKSNVPNQNPPGCPNPPGVVSIISQALNAMYFSKGLYATPQLLERLAFTESSYQQFVTGSLSQPLSVARCHSQPSQPITGLWPYESMAVPKSHPPLKRGHFVGLMQVPNSEDMGFNWISNITMGADVFMDKIRVAKKYSYDRVHKDKDTPPLPVGLTSDQLEDVAVGKFKNLAYYWVPQCSTNSTQTKGNCVGGIWSWVTNPKPCTNNTNVCDASLNVITQVNLVRESSAPCEQ